MIYNSNFFSKELKQGYVESSVSKKRQIAFGVFLGLISFSLYFFMQTIERSVVMEVAPQLMYDSYFSTLYIFINIASVCYAIYIVVYYEYLSFVEIVRNRWYTLVKMGYDTSSMILTKICARIISVGFIYTVGFITTIGLTAFLKFPFIFEYIPTLYVAGFIDLVLITVLTMVVSLVIKNSNVSRYMILVSCLVVFLVKWATGFTEIVANRDMMKNLLNLFDLNKSNFIIVAIIVTFLSLVIGIIRAKNIAKYYNFPHYKTEIGLNKDVEIVILDDKGTYTPSKDYLVRKENKSMNIVFTTVLTIVLAVSIFINGIVLLISVSSSSKEVTMFGYIPYIFLSETMEPSIMFNDLAFFEKIDQQKDIEIGDIIIYDETKGDNVEIARVKNIKGENITVDIDKYPDNSSKKEKLKTINKKHIYGLYADRSRWLGAIILFANSTLGRLMFLIIPAVLIFFYKEINKFFNEVLKGGLKE